MENEVSPRRTHNCLSSKLKEQLLYLPRKSRSLTNLQRVGSLCAFFMRPKQDTDSDRNHMSVPYSMLGHPVSSQRGYLARRLTGEMGSEIGSALLPRTYTVFCTPETAERHTCVGRDAHTLAGACV